MNIRRTEVRLYYDHLNRFDQTEIRFSSLLLLVLTRSGSPSSHNHPRGPCFNPIQDSVTDGATMCLLNIHKTQYTCTYTSTPVLTHFATGIQLTNC